MKLTVVMVWNGIDPRAVVPSDSLSMAKSTVIGTGVHARRSPVPFGLAVYKVDSAQGKVPMKLFFVSKKLALQLHVLQGWYIIGEPGTVFELRVTLVQTNHYCFSSLNSDGGNAIAFRLLLDGRAAMHAILDAKQELGTGSERVFKGFVESASFNQWEEQGTGVTREFVFRKVDTVEDEGHTLDVSIGSIELQTVIGSTKEATLEEMVWNATEKPEKKVKKKNVREQGKTIAVGQCDEELLTNVSRGRMIMWEYALLGKVTIYVREKNFMVARGLVAATEEPSASNAGISKINDVATPEENEQQNSHLNNDKPTSRNKKSIQEPGFMLVESEPQHTLSCSIGKTSHLMFRQKRADDKNVNEFPGVGYVNSHKRPVSPDGSPVPQPRSKRMKTDTRDRNETGGTNAEESPEFSLLPTGGSLTM